MCPQELNCLAIYARPISLSMRDLARYLCAKCELPGTDDGDVRTGSLPYVRALKTKYSNVEIT
eukprot:1855072-Rhodomonas_salina.1